MVLVLIVTVIVVVAVAVVMVIFAVPGHVGLVPTLWSSLFFLGMTIHFCPQSQLLLLLSSVSFDSSFSSHADNGGCSGMMRARCTNVMRWICWPLQKKLCIDNNFCWWWWRGSSLLLLMMMPSFWCHNDLNDCAREVDFFLPTSWFKNTKNLDGESTPFFLRSSALSPPFASQRGLLFTLVSHLNISRSLANCHEEKVSGLRVNSSS